MTPLIIAIHSRLIARVSGIILLAFEIWFFFNRKKSSGQLKHRKLFQCRYIISSLMNCANLTIQTWVWNEKVSQASKFSQWIYCANEIDHTKKMQRRQTFQYLFSCRHHRLRFYPNYNIFVAFTTRRFKNSLSEAEKLTCLLTFVWQFSQSICSWFF